MGRATSQAFGRYASTVSTTQQGRRFALFFMFMTTFPSLVRFSTACACLPAPADRQTRTDTQAAPNPNLIYASHEHDLIRSTIQSQQQQQQQQQRSYYSNDDDDKPAPQDDYFDDHHDNNNIRVDVDVDEYDYLASYNRTKDYDMPPRREGGGRPQIYVDDDISQPSFLTEPESYVSSSSKKKKTKKKTREYYG